MVHRTAYVQLCHYDNVLYISLFYSYAVITVSPTLTAVTVQEPNQTATIQLSLTLVTDPLPITITYITTDGTATGIYYV